MPHSRSYPGASPESQSRIVHVRFDVRSEPVHRQLLTWRERLGPIMDVLPTRAQIERPFRGTIDWYEFGELLFADTYTDELTRERTIGRISQDNARGIAFHIVIDGDATTLVTRPGKRENTSIEVGILAVDFDQPVHVVRRACRHVTLFVPYTALQEVFPDPGALHGRVLTMNEPAAQVIRQRVKVFSASIPHMLFNEAHRHLREIVELIADAFGEQAGLSGSKHAITRAVTFEAARRFVQANLTEFDLSPTCVVESLALSRATVYRLFQHEGGLHAYIRHLRLRAAANDLVRFPGVPVAQIAFSVGFSSASDFTRAFRRAYGFTPQDVRTYKDWFLGPQP
ncbi:HTH-type transcriptional activator RhaS [Paraburkholderia domus]|nr:helix-turn-helix transcriptional regulator [Burkholderia sp. R-70006]CAE6823466.1 HTH-type transcriptional activator RhaS [Paraburkholderia domus]CAE6834258.1 HTH-type transcriptional activator RhaS [Paraburkholderia domus]